jgi:spermidine/putrescine transport system substrate-binding protein
MSVISRRALLWNALPLVLGWGACDRRWGSQHNDAAVLPRLTICTWSDYIKPELIEDFERRFGCQVDVRIFGSNEELAVMLEASTEAFDLLTPSSYMVVKLHKQGLLSRFELDRMPNVSRVRKSFIEASEISDLSVSVPFQISFTGIASKAEYAHDLSSWRVFDSEALNGRFTLLDDMREVLGAALRAVGASANSTDAADMEKATGVASLWLKRVSNLDRSNYRALIGLGEVHASQAFSGDVAKAVKEGLFNLSFPSEGFLSSSDDFCLLATSERKALAHEFVNFMHCPENAAANMEWSGYQIPNDDAVRLLRDSTRSNPAIFPDPATMARAEQLRYANGAEAVFENAWLKIITGHMRALGE